MGLLKGRVAVITGAGQGIGREHAVLFAREGPAVVVSDLGGSMSGSGRDTGPAHEVVELIRASGGTAVANTDDVTDFDASAAMVEQAVGRVRHARHRREQRGHPAQRRLGDHVGTGFRPGGRGASQGPFQPEPACRRLLADLAQGRRTGAGGHRQHHLAIGHHHRHAGAGQLRPGQGRHRGVDPGQRRRARPADASAGEGRMRMPHNASAVRPAPTRADDTDTEQIISRAPRRGRTRRNVAP